LSFKAKSCLFSFKTASTTLLLINYLSSASKQMFFGGASEDVRERDAKSKKKEAEKLLKLNI
jgi:hypothetical protein